MTYNIQLTTQEQELVTFLKVKAEELDVKVRICGGFVRDKLIGITSHDIDIAIEGTSGAVFAKHCGNNVAIIEARPEQSKHLETAMVQLFGIYIDCCGLRKETYTDSRIPVIDTGTPEEDARRRDLTINALFYNIHTNEIEDYVGGLSDLENRIARTPLQAKQTFLDDPLRVLRCIRFCAKYDLRPTFSIVNAANDAEVQSAFLSKISKERIFNEVFGQAESTGWKPGFCTNFNYTLALQFVLSFGFMDILFSPRDVQLNPWNTDQNNAYHDLSILYHTLKAIERLNCTEHSNLEAGIVIMALICHDLGKRDSGCIQVKDSGQFSYLGHDDRSVELGDIVLKQMSCPNDIRDRILNLVKHHMRYHDLPENPTDKSLRKIVRDVGNDWPLLLLHTEADACGKISADVDAMRKKHLYLFNRTHKALEAQGGVSKAPRPITGHDLLLMGIPQGPKMGDIFKKLDEELLNNPSMTKEEAEEFVRKY